MGQDTQHLRSLTPVGIADLSIQLRGTQSKFPTQPHGEVQSAANLPAKGRVRLRSAVDAGDSQKLDQVIQKFISVRIDPSISCRTHTEPPVTVNRSDIIRLKQSAQKAWMGSKSKPKARGPSNSMPLGVFHIGSQGNRRTATFSLGLRLGLHTGRPVSASTMQIRSGAV